MLYSSGAHQQWMLRCLAKKNSRTRSTQPKIFQDGPYLVHFGAFVFCVTCCGKYRDRAGIQRPPTSARLIVMARQITGQTGKVSLFGLIRFSSVISVLTPLLLKNLCMSCMCTVEWLKPGPKSLFVSAHTFCWSWALKSVILFSASHSGCCQSYLPNICHLLMLRVAPPWNCRFEIVY